MRGNVSTCTPASRVPLFDRLCPEAAASTLGQPLQGTELEASLACDLLRLLNTRNGLTIAEFLVREGSVLDYGMPDVLTLGLQSDADRQVLAEVVSRAITTFELRLRSVTVKAGPDERCPQRARLAVTASVAVGRQLRLVEFDIALDETGTPEAP